MKNSIKYIKAIINKLRKKSHCDDHTLTCFLKNVKTYIPQITDIARISERNLNQNSGIEINLFIEKHEIDLCDEAGLTPKRIDMGENAQAIRFLENQNLIYINKNFLCKLYNFIHENECNIEKIYNEYSHKFKIDKNHDFQNIIDLICFNAAKMLILHELMHVIRVHLNTKANNTMQNSDRLMEIDADIHALIYVLNDLTDNEMWDIGLFTSVLGVHYLFLFLDKNKSYPSSYYDKNTNYPAPVVRFFIAFSFALTRDKKSNLEQKNSERDILCKSFLIYINIFDLNKIEDLQSYLENNGDLKNYPKFLEDLDKCHASNKL